MNKISQQDLDKILYIKKELEEIIYNIGLKNSQIIILREELKKFEEDLFKYKKNESELMEELISKYGNIDIDLKTGEYKTI